MNLTYKQRFLQEKNLQQTLYGKFGYNIESMNQVVQKKKKNDSYPVTANIKLRKVTPSLYRNQKIDQIQKQIQDISKDRKRRQQQSKLTKNSQDSDKYINKMNHIINHYNYLIDHKHIKQKGTEEARKMLNIQPKTQAEKALQQINELNEVLVRANIKEQFKINKKINDLYRLFKDRIDDPPQMVTHRKRFLSQQVKDSEKVSNFRVMSRAMQESHRGSSINSKPHQKKNQKDKLNSTMGYSLHQINHNNQKSENYLNVSLNEMQMRKIKSHIDNHQFTKKPLQAIEQSFMRISPQKAKQQGLKRKKLESQLEHQIIEPYVTKEFIQSGKKMDVKIKNNSDALQLWRGRIAEAIPIQKENHIRSTKKLQAQKDEFDFQNQERFLRKLDNIQYELDLKQHVPYIENKNNFKHQTVQILKQKNQEQEQILSGLLGKRNCKYLRPWGTKILVKYNASKQAKQMLGLSPSKQAKHDAEHQSQQNFKTKNLAQKLDEKLKLPLNIFLNKQNQVQTEMDWDKQIDEQYYWTMCKNEKINLLLKGKRR